MSAIEVVYKNDPGTRISINLLATEHKKVDLVYLSVCLKVEKGIERRTFASHDSHDMVCSFPF